MGDERELEYKSLKTSQKEIRRACKELLPIRINPELETFLKENRFKTQEFPDEVRAQIQLAMRKSFDDNTINFITGYMKEDIMIWIFEGFCTLGGKILIEDTEESKDFFDLLGDAGYKLLMYGGKLSSYLNLKRGKSIHEIAGIYDDVLALSLMQKNILQESEVPGKTTGFVINPENMPFGKKIRFLPPDEEYEPDMETNEFLQGFFDMTPLVSFAEYKVRGMFSDNCKLLRFYYDRQNNIWIVRTKTDWRVLCEVFVDVTLKEARQFRHSVEVEMGGMREWVEQLPSKDLDEHTLHTTTLYKVGSATDLDGLCGLYEKACFWQNKQAELVAE